MLTLKKVNSEIANKGIKAKLVKAKEGYFYFEGDDVLPGSCGIFVYRLNHLNMSSWIYHLNLRLKKDR